ncbi:MAG: RNA 2',3'-cyclic phosphodiesterase [Nitrospirota bacterium]|nr:RNA 2',3'-cyclic phosphodiesterase [Nitrospirota bacterium]
MITGSGQQAMRCFIAITLPEEIKRGMTAIQGRLRAAGADVSWTRPEGMHLTLKFLGEVEEKRVPKIEAALDSAANGIGAFSMSVSGMGTFPDTKRPRVVWIGLKEDGDSLINLQGNVERELVTIGFPLEKKGFTPHITLGRIRSNRNIEKLLDLIGEEKGVEFNGFTVRKVHLMESQLRSTGAIYTELYSAALI